MDQFEKCDHPDHVEGEVCEERSVGCSKHCTCCMGSTATPLPEGTVGGTNKVPYEEVQHTFSQQELLDEVYRWMPSKYPGVKVIDPDAYFERYQMLVDFVSHLIAEKSK